MVFQNISKENLCTPILLFMVITIVVPMEMTNIAFKNLESLGFTVQKYFSKGLAAFFRWIIRGK